MPGTESDHHHGDAAVARIDLLELAPTTTTTTTSNCATAAAARDEEEEDDGFTFAAALHLAAADDAFFPDARIGPVYPVFGRPRSPPKQQRQQEEEGPAGTAAVRVPLGRLLLEDRHCAPSSAQPADDAELDGVPAETYCLWSPGVSPAPAGSSRTSSSPAARCRKSGSTGSVLRWRQRVVGRSHSDGKDKFVFISTSSERGSGKGHGWTNVMNHRRGGRSKSTFLPYKQDLVGLFASAVAFRRSYHPF